MSQQEVLHRYEYDGQVVGARRISPSHVFFLLVVNGKGTLTVQDKDVVWLLVENQGERTVAHVVVDRVIDRGQEKDRVASVMIRANRSQLGNLMLSIGYGTPTIVAVTQKEETLF